MENQIQEETEDISPIKFNEEIKNYLYEAAKWGKMLAIVGFIGIGFMAILGIFLGAGYSFMSWATAGLARMPGGSIGLSIIYILMALLHLFPTLFLYQFSDNTKEAIDHNSELQMTEAFARLKSLFKFCGIYILVIAIFYVLVIIAATIGGITFMHSMQG